MTLLDWVAAGIWPRPVSNMYSEYEPKIVCSACGKEIRFYEYQVYSIMNNSLVCLDHASRWEPCPVANGDLDT